MNKLFKKRLNAMLKDEKKAPYDYSKLMHATKDNSIKNKIRKIQVQERKHHKILTGIKRRLD